jgi:peroxiredoxin Q/BCP
MTAYQGGIAKFTNTDSIVFGISADDVETNKKFAESLNLEFALLSDTGGATIKAYGILNERGMANRTTFIVDKKGLIQEVISGGDAISIDGAASACSRL